MKIGISVGDINGIGLEVILKTFSNPAMTELCTPIIYCGSKTLGFHKKALNLNEFNYNGIKSADQALSRKVNMVYTWDEEVEIKFGEENETGGKYALLSLQAAVADLKSGSIDALVTAPLSKGNIPLEGFTGHTGYIAKEFGIEKYAMMLLSEELKVALVTEHIPITEIGQHITIQKVYDKIKTVYNTLQKDFGITNPKIAVLGLNPHAGDKGAIGKEEQTILLPAIQKAKDEKMVVYGCYSADGFFGTKAFQQFDVVLAMYHDQGLIPFKAMAFESGVNFTAALPVIRTSPDHGTAFDIAGKGIANETSFRNAVYTAIDIFRTRHDEQQNNLKPLPFSQFRREKFRMDFMKD
ncbi:MAG: 4-hydroxythreonine-4-phosphate dehydrogenase PdxA [Bacteroidetes bacterium]|nr:4-hydroxythreonine-4-phosphate dehydrogenase PdxA [Bacteroidota bacterium]